MYNKQKKDSPAMTTPRWQYRFDNFKRAYLLLSEAMETRHQRELTQLENECLDVTHDSVFVVCANFLDHVLLGIGVTSEEIGDTAE